jgi:hypothetical protein
MRTTLSTKVSVSSHTAFFSARANAVLLPLYLYASSEAAEDLRRDRNQFASNVKRSLGGGVIKGVTYDRALR